MVQSWREELSTLEAKATETRPLLEQLEGCRRYLERAEKRRAAKAEEIARMQEELQEMDADLDEHRQRLQTLEEQAKPATTLPSGLKPPWQMMQAFQALTDQMQEVQGSIQEAKRRRKEPEAAAVPVPEGEGAAPPAQSRSPSPDDNPLTPIISMMKDLSLQFQAWVQQAEAPPDEETVPATVPMQP